MSFELSHPFYWDEIFSPKDGLRLEPGLYFGAGTNNFYNNFYKQRSTQLRKNLKPNQNTPADSLSSSLYDASAAAFQLREFTFSLPLTFTYGSFSITPEWNYIYPLNQPDDPDFKIEPYTLWKVGLTYKFKLY